MALGVRAPARALACEPYPRHNGAMPEEPKPPRKKRWAWWKTVLLVLALLIVGLVVARWQWGKHADKVLQAEIDAIRARGEPLDWLEFKPKPIPDEENAAELYRKAWAIALLDPALAADDQEATRLERLGSMVSDLAYYPEFRREHAKDVPQILALSAESLALCRKARGLKQADWKLTFRGPAIAVIIPALSQQRNLARLLWLAAICAHEAGDDAAAVEYVRDALAVGRVGGKGPTIIHMLVHVGVDAQATILVQEVAPALRVGGDRGATAQQVRDLIAELLDEKPLRESMLLGFMGERAMLYDTFERFRRGQMVAGGGLTVPNPGGPFVIAFQPILKADEVRMLRHMSGYIEAMREKTYPAAVAKLPVYVPPKSKLQMLTRLLSSILTPSLNRAATLCYRQLATRKMAAVALAIRLYEIDTGRRPAKLAALVGKYLPALPTDPFAADARPLGYLPKAEKPRLYSISRDGKDDAGKFALTKDGGIDYDALDLVFFLNKGDRPMRPCDWEDPTTQPARKRPLPMRPGRPARPTPATRPAEAVTRPTGGR